MRVSQSMLQMSALSHLRVRLEAVARAQSQSLSGRRVQSASDSPADAARIMDLDSRLRSMETYRHGAAAARTRLAAEEAVLSTVGDLLGRARAFALGAASDDPNDPTRLAALAEIGKILEQVIAFGNTQVGGEYILAGSRTDAPAFLADGTYAGDTRVREALIDDQLRIETNHTGDQVLSGAISSLQDLATQLQSGDADAIRATLAGLATAGDEVLAAESELGSRQQQIELTGTILLQRAARFANERDSLRDADPTESTVAVLSAQSALDRAYSVVGRVLQTSLLDYLR